MSLVIKHLYHTFLGDSQNYQPLGELYHNAFLPVTNASQTELVLRELSPGLIFWFTT